MATNAFCKLIYNSAVSCHHYPKFTDMVQEKTPTIRNRKQYQALRERGLSKELAARIANAPHPDDPYRDKTYDELYELAKARDIEGRSNMKKSELIVALRAAEK